MMQRLKIWPGMEPTTALACMVRYWDLARDLLLLAKNCVLGHTWTLRNLEGAAMRNLEDSVGLRFFFLTLFCAANLSFGHEEAFGMNKFGYLMVD